MVSSLRDERLPKGPRFASESLDADTASGSGFQTEPLLDPYFSATALRLARAQRNEAIGDTKSNPILPKALRNLTHQPGCRPPLAVSRETTRKRALNRPTVFIPALISLHPSIFPDTPSPMDSCLRRRGRRQFRSVQDSCFFKLFYSV